MPPPSQQMPQSLAFLKGGSLGVAVAGNGAGGRCAGGRRAGGRRAGSRCAGLLWNTRHGTGDILGLFQTKLVPSGRGTTDKRG